MSTFFIFLFILSYISQFIESLGADQNLLGLVQQVASTAYSISTSSDNGNFTGPKLLEYTVAYFSAGIRCVRDKFSAADNFDKPNWHRLVEPVVDAISTFFHCFQLSELVIELVDRVFRSLIESSSYPNVHFNAMDPALSQDWIFQIRVLL